MSGGRGEVKIVPAPILSMATVFGLSAAGGRGSLGG